MAAPAEKKTKMMTTTTANTNQIGRRWNDLPEDLVDREIMVRLSSADRIRLAACCKNFWSSILDYNNPETDQLPWLVKSYYDHSSVPTGFELFDPIHKSPYSRTSIKEIIGQSKFFKHGIQLLASKHGWLLSSFEKESGLRCIIVSFVLVSPFTKNFIILPDLTEYEPTKSAVAAFSAEPGDPDCSYFLMHQPDDGYYFTISIYRSGDSSWTIMGRCGLTPFCGVAYHEGSFYYGTSENYKAYDVVTDEWKQVSDAKLTKSLGPNFGRERYKQFPYLLSCEGKLLLVYLFVPLPSDKDDDRRKDRCLVYEYLGQRDWVEKTSLGDHALFVCPCGSFSVLSSSATSEIANRIYYYRPDYDGKKHYYSLEDGKSYPCGSSYWPGTEASGTWIQPPQLKMK